MSANPTDPEAALERARREAHEYCIRNDGQAPHDGSVCRGGLHRRIAALESAARLAGRVEQAERDARIADEHIAEECCAPPKSRANRLPMGHSRTGHLIREERDRLREDGEGAEMKPRGRLRVFGYQSHRYECPPAPNGGRQTREIVAAHSIAEVRRLSGLSKTEAERFCCETGNAEEAALAMSSPGVVFWRPLDQRNGGWTRAKEPSGA